MFSFDLTLSTLEENLAFDEALLLQSEHGPGAEMLRFWEWSSLGVVLGAGGEIHKEVSETLCVQDAIPILRRSSGGGTVLLGQGCLLYSLILEVKRSPFLTQIHSSYRYILERMGKALCSLGTMEQDGISDLTFEGRKFSGNAQQRKQKYILHHGTLLYDFDLTQISKYLKEPERQPEYRHHRLHRDFVRNLPSNRETLISLIHTEWQAVEKPMDIPTQRIEELLAEKYRQEEWIRRR
jgi:lipoate---protein ligase